MVNSNNWRAELVDAYPDIFHPVGDPPSAQGWPEVGDSRCDLLERCCCRIRAAVQADGGTFQATQIKEKYGTLRFYWRAALSPDADAKVEEAIDRAEARSACTCEICGEPGRMYGPGWLTTRCTAHAEGGRPEEIRPDSRTSSSRTGTSSIGAWCAAVATTARTTSLSTSTPPRLESRRSEMAGIVKDWRIELIEAHRSYSVRRLGLPGAALGYPRGEGGWRDLLQRLCVRLEAALGGDERIHLDRIREAVGRLRVSWRGQVIPRPYPEFTRLSPKHAAHAPASSAENRGDSIWTVASA